MCCRLAICKTTTKKTATHKNEFFNLKKVDEWIPEDNLPNEQREDGQDADDGGDCAGGGPPGPDGLLWRGQQGLAGGPQEHGDVLARHHRLLLHGLRDGGRAFLLPQQHGGLGDAARPGRAVSGKHGADVRHFFT